MKASTFLIVAVIICGVAMVFVGGCLNQKPMVVREDMANLDREMTTPNNAGTPSSMYGCPGCPSSFMGFAKDMCNRMGPGFTVSDGINTLKCSEIVNET